MRSIYFCLVCWFSIITAFFILCSNLIFLPILLAQDLSPPTVSTGEATDVTSSSATLNGTVSGRAPAVWFQYGTTSSSYYYSASVSWSGPGIDTVTSSLSGLSAATTYYYRIAAYDSYPGYTTDTAYGSEKSFTTLTATPTVTPTPVCEVESMSVSPKRLMLKRGKIREVTVTLHGKDDCLPEGKIVNVTINKVGNKLISVTPTSQATDVNGTVKFTITAMNKIGNARVAFETASLKRLLTVKVRR